MKTVFQRTMSVILCVILVLSMSTTAFAATADIKYDRFMDASSKSVAMNIKPLLDAADRELKEMDIKINETIAGINVSVDLTSVDNICKTLDEFKGIINLASNFLGDLKDLELGTFDKGLSRAKSGDVKIIGEFLELASANEKLIKKVIENNGLSLGSILDGVLKDNGLDLSNLFGENGASGLVKEIVVGLTYEEGTEAYNTAYAKAIDNFDAYLFEDVIPAKLGINSSSSLDTLIKNAFSILIDNYLVSLVEDLKNGLKDTKYASLFNLDAINKDAVKFTADGGTVLQQINGVLGALLTQLVDGYSWESGSWEMIEVNVSGMFKYLAQQIGIDTANKTNEQIMVAVISDVLTELNVGGVAEGVAECTSLEDMATILAINVAKNRGITTVYDSNDTYEVVLGDILIDLAGDLFLIADENGNKCEVGAGYDIWTVLNYCANYFFVDKNLDSLLGKDGMTKTSTIFDKLDVVFGMFCTNAVDTETYLKALIKSIFTVDLGAFVELTAVKILDGRETTNAVEYLYTGLYTFTKNWAGEDVVLPYTATKPLNNAVSDTGLASIINGVLGALKSRANGLASGLGLLVGLDETVSVNLSVADMVYTGGAANPAVTLSLDGTVLEKGKDYTVTFSGNSIGTQTATVTGIGAYDGQISENFNIKLGNVYGLSYTATGNSVTLKWNAVAGATSYNIYNGTKLVGTAKTNSYTVTGLASGTKYTFKVEAVCGDKTSSKVQINAATSIGQVTGLTAKVDGSSVKLSWKALNGASGYVVQCYIYGNWENLTTVTGTSTVVSAAANTSYSYRILPYMTENGTRVYGQTSATVAVRTAPRAPATLSASKATQSSVNLKWSAVSGVKGYAVEKYENGAWKLVKNTTATSLKVTGLASGTAYKFRVRAYVTVGGKNVYSAYSKTVSATTKVGVPANLKFVNATSSTVEISWTPVKGAKAYQVQYKVGSKWKKLKVTKASATIKKLSTNKTYKVKVRAINADGSYGSFTSEISTATATAKVNLKSVKPGKKRLTASWAKVAGAKGYEVVYSTSKKFTKKTTKTVTIKKAKTVKTTVKKLKKGKKYFVKVRAYKVVNGKKVYSAWSTVKNVKVK